MLLIAMDATYEKNKQNNATIIPWYKAFLSVIVKTQLRIGTCSSLL